MRAQKGMGLLIPEDKGESSDMESQKCPGEDGN